MLEQIAGGCGNVWGAECTLRNLLGFPMTSRMTVLRLSCDRLLLHSPVRLTPELRSALERLGRVAWLVAPNRFHHMFLAGYQPAFPEARLVAVPGLPAKRPDLMFDRVLGEAPEPDWDGEAEHVLIAGSPTMGEAAFYHPASRSLLVTDLLLNVDASCPSGLRLWARLNGVCGVPATARIVRPTYRDRAAARASAERILRWDFQRIVPCHGAVIEAEARAVFARAVRWLD